MSPPVAIAEGRSRELSKDPPPPVKKVRISTQFVEEIDPASTHRDDSWHEGSSSSAAAADERSKRKKKHKKEEKNLNISTASSEARSSQQSRGGLSEARSWTSQLLGAANDAENTDYDSDRYPIRELHYKFEDDVISFNPMTTLIAITFLWGTVIWCMLEPQRANEMLIRMRGVVTLKFSWFFMGSKALFFFFIMFIVIKYGHIKMGNQPPEFDSVSYFCMIFAAGVAVGLFVFGVAEPLWHQNSHYYANAGYHTQDEIDMFAINMTVTNWAISGWTSYMVVAIAMALAGYRFNLPMVFRSIFYPILGEYTWGWLGDVLDGFAMVVIVSGVCTSLGLGAAQIVVGMQYLGWINSKLLPDEVTRIQNVVIWGVTAISTASFLAGIRSGIRSLSFVAFLSGMLLLFLVGMMDNGQYILNLMVQEVGYYCQYSIFLLNFWTDPFGQLREGEGRAIDGREAAIWWMDAWMVFYQAWWVSWAAFVGIFIARISRGRTIGEMAMYGLVLPTLYCIVWFCVWGGVGIRQSRQALELQKLGLDYWGDDREFLSQGSSFCYDVPQEDTYSPNGTLVFQNHLPGVTPVCQFDSSNGDQAAFNVLFSFSFPLDFPSGGYGPALGIIFILSLTLYFSTSSDSGSFVVDLLASNGRMRHHWIQRLFWSLTEAAFATALLTAGGPAALRAVQAASIIAGLPFNLLMWFMVQTIYMFCDHADKHPDRIHFKHIPVRAEESRPDERTRQRSEFSMPVYGGIFNVFEYLFSLGRVHRRRVIMGMDLPSRRQLTELAKAVFLPSYSLYQILQAAYPENPVTNLWGVIGYSFLLITWVALFCAAALFEKRALNFWGWATFLVAGVVFSSYRNGFRLRFGNVRSHLFADVVVGLFLWPQGLVQMRLHCIELGLCDPPEPEPEPESERPRMVPEHELSFQERSTRALRIQIT